VLIIALLLPFEANSGILNGLSKLSKAVKDTDINVPLNKVNLPENIKGLTTETIKMDASGNLVVIHADGSRTPLQLFNKANNKNKALIISEYDIPEDLEILDSIPKKIPLFIKDKANNFYEIKRDSGYKLKFKNVEIKVSDKDTLREAFWFFQKPSHKKQARYIQLTNSIEDLAIKRYGNNTGIEKTGISHLMNVINKMTNQSLILSGKVKNGRLYTDDNAASIKLSELKKVAEENDLQLTILSSDSPHKALSNIRRKLKPEYKDGRIQYQTNAEYFNQIADANQTNMIEISVSERGDRQLAVQWINKEHDLERAVNKSPGLMMLPLHISLHSITVLQPDRERQKELDARIIENINSWLQFYIISSAVLGFIAIGTSWRLWKKIWQPDKPTDPGWNIGYYLLLVVHRLLFILIHLPLLGLFSFIWMIIYVSYRIINFVLIVPVVWISGALFCLTRRLISQ